MSDLESKADMPEPLANVRFSNRPFGVKHFQTVRRQSEPMRVRLLVHTGV
jgi:hypothetical protein